MIPVKPPFAHALDRGNPLSHGVVGAWFFTEGSGLMAYDISGRDNHGTREGWAANTGWAAGPSGGLLDWNEGNGASADPRINCGNKASLTNLSEFTFMGRIRPNSVGRGNGARLFAKNTQKNFNAVVNTSNNIDLSVNRASVNALARAVNNTWENGVWMTLVGRYSSADGPRIYKGSGDGRIAEVGYAIQTVGSGSESADSGGNFYLGNRSALDRPMDGLYDWALIWNRMLSLDEMQAAHENPFSLITRPHSVTFWDIGGGGPPPAPSGLVTRKALLGVGV